MTKKAKVWILTTEHNDYDQYGEYFVAAFSKKPTHKALANALTSLVSGNDVMAALALLEHILSGGGRQNTEDQWFNLNEVEFSDD